MVILNLFEIRLDVTRETPNRELNTIHDIILCE